GAHNVVALGGKVSAVGIVGDDAPATHLLDQLARLSIEHTGVVVDRSRCTTRKLRVVTMRNQQVARIDYESDLEVSGALEAAVIARIVEQVATADAVLMSDYLKGVIS